MRITQIDLENFKSYRRESVTFTPGTNAICGPNGAGKSSLLEAIGFALFDHSPYSSQESLVREGEKTATITVHLVDEDERIYQVIRKCGSSRQHYVYDPELDQKLSDGVKETVSWLYEFLGVDESIRLSALFEDAVGVPQGMLTAAFLSRPGNRKNIFNPLLRVDEYEQVWHALLDPRRQLKDSIQELDKQIAGLEAEAKALPNWQQKANDLQTKIAADQESQAVLQSELRDVTQRKQAQEAVKQRLDELSQVFAQTGADVKTLQAQLIEAQGAVERAEKARSVVEKSQAGYQAYLTAQASLETLEEQREERDRLQKRRQGHITDLALARQQVERLEAELEDIAAAAARMETLRSQVEAQEQLEQQLTRSQRAADRLVDTERNLRQERLRLVDLGTKLTRAQAGLDQRTELETEIAVLQEALPNLDAERDMLTMQIAAIRAELDQIAEQTVALKAAETAECPVCEGPLTLEHRAELLTRNQVYQKELQAALARAQSQQNETEQARRQTQKTLRQLEKQARELPRPAEAEDLLVQIEGQQKAVTETESVVAELSDAPADTERIQEELERLGNPRRDYQRAVDTVGQQDTVGKNLTTTKNRIAQQSAQIDTLNTELLAYADLDERIKAEREILDTQAADHQRYLEHIREAGTLEKRQERIAALQEKAGAAQARHDRVSEERDQVAAGYDAVDYAELTETYSTLRGQMATVGERLRQQQSQLEEAQTEMARLAGVQAEQQAVHVEYLEQKELLALLEYLRQLLRAAGPKITQVLVEMISLHAARLYADIMADHTARLRWTEDYEILLTTGGRERSFQQLSGGEQMTAALAVRLALLHEVSAIDIAFFDEPTANLDDRRRDNLAEQILNVKGFSQLFVISHDDTFEQDTDNVVRVIKENGISRVEA